MKVILNIRQSIQVNYRLALKQRRGDSAAHMYLWKVLVLHSFCEIYPSYPSVSSKFFPVRMARIYTPGLGDVDPTEQPPDRRPEPTQGVRDREGGYVSLQAP